MLPLLSLLLLSVSVARAVVFRDVTIQANLLQPAPSTKFGGPYIADVDNDGYYDLFLPNHNLMPPQIYFGTSSGKFRLFDFRIRRLLYPDVHGINFGYRTARDPYKLISVSIGGGNGARPNKPEMYAVVKENNGGVSFKNVTESWGLGRTAGRARCTVFMDLKLRSAAASRANGGGPDILFMNYLGEAGSGFKQFAYENVQGRYRLRAVPGLETERRGRTELTDIDNDGVMEVISIREFQVYKLVAPFTFREITQQVVPADSGIDKLTVAAVAEFDYDNDGDFDLYIAIADRKHLTHRTSIIGDDHSDVLLENINGRYVDVSRRAGLPKRTNSLGVTVGDFNNDGYTDVFVTQRTQRDFLLLNNGDGAFRKQDGGVSKRGGSAFGNNAMAVDYDNDGRLDLLVAQGPQDDQYGAGRLGQYKLMRNVGVNTDTHRFLIVVVRAEPAAGATSLHATVTVALARKGTVTRRVGSVGAQAAGASYMDRVHVGVGEETVVKFVRVRWSTGMAVTKRNVQTNTQVVFGR